MRRGRRRCMFGVAALVASASLVPCSSAVAVSFGPALGTAPFNVVPTHAYDCSVVVYPVVGLTPLPGPTGGTATSCIWIHVPTPAEVQAAGGRNISLEPPGTGTVTQVHVGVGAHTGPMQIVVMRALYENTLTPGRPNDACCFPVARSQVFTPQPNAIGKLLLQDAAGGGVRLTADARTGRIAAHRVTTYGSASFKVSAGKRKTLSVRLSSAGKRLMSRHRTVKVWANVTLSSGQTRSYTARITLHR